MQQVVWILSKNQVPAAHHDKVSVSCPVTKLKTALWQKYQFYSQGIAMSSALVTFLIRDGCIRMLCFALLGGHFPQSYQ